MSPNATSNRSPGSPSLGNASFGPLLKWTLIVSIVVFFGYFALFFTPLDVPPIVMLLASILALIAAPIAVVRVIRRVALRSRGNVVLVSLATTASLPALAVSAYFLSLVLPLSPWERDAIAGAEAFVLKNGYTAADHPSRFGLLKPTALGIVGAKWFGYNVLFEYARPRSEEGGGSRELFVVHIEPNGDILTPHITPTYPDWYIKRNAR